MGPTILRMGRRVFLSLLDKLKFTRKKTARQLVGVKDIKDYSLELYNGGALLFYKIQPANINTLPETVLGAKITNLMTVIKSITDIEISCFNTAENFGGNREYLQSRLAEEQENKIKELLRKDLKYIDHIKNEMATAKDFLITVRFNMREREQIPVSVHRIEKTIKDSGFCPKLLTKADIKHMLAVYYEQNISDDAHEDYSGQRWVAQNGDGPVHERRA